MNKLGQLETYNEDIWNYYRQGMKIGLRLVQIMIKNDYINYNKMVYEFHYGSIVFQVSGDVSQKSACYMSLLA